MWVSVGLLPAVANKRACCKQPARGGQKPGFRVGRYFCGIRRKYKPRTRWRSGLVGMGLTLHLVDQLAELFEMGRRLGARAKIKLNTINGVHDRGVITFAE